jgi:DMSO reductase anchor subunit
VLVIPGVIYLWPAGGSVLGAHYRTAMLVLPMAPAVLLGIVAVWSMKNRR